MRIRQAAFPQDRQSVRRYFTAYVRDIAGDAGPVLERAILSKYPQESLDAAIAECERIHLPPDGALVLAESDEDAPLGCGMMRMLTPRVAESQRIYVAPAGRGQGLGRALTETLCAAAAARGASRVRLDTARDAVAPVALYRAMGFAEVAPYHDDYPELQPHLVFFERAL